MFRSFSGEFVSDFEAMLARKRDQASKRRKRRDIDIINDNDDIIDQLIQNMRQAAEVMLDEEFTYFKHRSRILDSFMYSNCRKIVN